MRTWEISEIPALHWCNPGSIGILFIPLVVTHTCFYMKRGEKPDGHRQMRPKTFPTSNSGGNSQQMLQEIRNSLRNLSKPSDPPKLDFSCAGKMHPEDLRPQGRSSNPKHPYHKALQEIRKSLMPFANEPCASGPETNKHMSAEPPFVGFEEVRLVECWSPLTKNAVDCHSLHSCIIRE